MRARRFWLPAKRQFWQRQVNSMKLILISGLSGSGKSVALKTLEDEGYYCCDNLPANLLISFVKELRFNRQNYTENAAIGIDARANAETIDLVPSLLARIRALGVEVEIIFLYANHAELARRFSETRRRHPLSHSERTLAESISYESEILANIQNLADLAVDTTEKSAAQLRQLILDHYSLNPLQPASKMALLLQSFGYKFSVPHDTSFIFDVRCLPNPHWQSELRPLTGRDQKVQDFLCQYDDVARMIDDIGSFIEAWLPRFEAENRRYLTVSIGCTGGQHRSVYVVEALAKRLSAKRSNVLKRHRQLDL